MRALTVEKAIEKYREELLNSAQANRQNANSPILRWPREKEKMLAEAEAQEAKAAKSMAVQVSSPILRNGREEWTTYILTDGQIPAVGSWKVIVVE